jgi:RHS repeat-associated protein
VKGKGRLYNEATQVGGVNDINAAHMAIDSYDALGRPLTKRQHFWQGSFWGPGYYVQQTYDLAGNVKTLTYPSGHTVKYSHDQAGRLSSFSGSLGGSPATYADMVSYNPAGQMIKERFGTNTSLYHNSHYNSRLQLVSTRLGDSATEEFNWSRGAFDFLYGTTAVTSGNIFANDTDNNGNLRRQLTYVPLAGGGYVISQRDDYTYDALNRVNSFTEAQMNSGGQWTLNVASQNFSYDPYGNRKITSATGGVNNYNPTYDTTNKTNRIVGLGYDAAGNITSDPMTGGLMTYDPENRMLTATNGGVSGSYTYNADGRRVRRITGGQETWHVYGIGGELLAEYAAGAAPNAPQKEYGYRNGQLLVIAEPGSGGNLAWGKATSQSSTGFGGNSSRGVDGNTSGDWGDNSVSHTNLERQPWWQVDLGSVQQIGTVRLWNRTDCCSDRLSDFHVLVSDNPFSSTDLTTTINQAGVSRYYTAGPAGALTEIGVGRSGRYVRVQLAGDNYLSLAEVEVMGRTASGEGVIWLVQDHLGSTRIVVDRSGSLGGVRRHDFAPFGEELSAGVGIRSAALGYGDDLVRQKFGSKERDIETGLDYFLARYFSSVQGRFTSPDEFKGGPHELWVLGSGDPEKQALVYADVTNPQSLNKYQYCFNNPLRYVDPDGQNPQDGGAGSAEDRDIRDYLAGRITKEELQQRQMARAAGALVGAAVVAAPEALTAVGLWAARNPNTAQNLAQEAVQMASGNPMSAPSWSVTLSAKSALRAAEVVSGERLAKQISGHLVESTHIGADFVNAVTKKTYDVMGVPKAYLPKNWGSGTDFFNSILGHLRKSADYIVIDLKGASKQQIGAIQKYVSGFTKEQRDRIIYLSP